MPLPIPAPRDSGFTRTTGVPLYWAAYGRAGAPRLLVLHGGPGADHRYLLPQMLRLAEQHDVVFYDQRGGGESRSAAREAITWRTQTEDLAAVIGELGLARAAVVGYSWGGLLAMLYLAEEATKASRMPPGRLALIDPAAVSRRYRTAFEAEFARRNHLPAIAAERAALAASGLRSTDPEAYRQRAFELSVAGYFDDPSRARDLTPFRVLGRVQQSVWASLDDYDLLPDLARARARLGVPALVVHGRQDPIPLASSSEAAEALGAELVVIERCGHVPFVERPEALFAALERFLGPSRAAGGGGAPDRGAGTRA